MDTTKQNGRELGKDNGGRYEIGCGKRLYDPTDSRSGTDGSGTQRDRGRCPHCGRTSLVCEILPDYLSRRTFTSITDRGIG